MSATYIKNHGARLFMLSAFLMSVMVAADAQSVEGRLSGYLHDVTMPLQLTGVLSPEALRDSLAFKEWMKRASWSRPEQPEWHELQNVGVSFSKTASAAGLIPAGGGTSFTGNPYAFDFSSAGALYTWGSGAIVGSSSRSTMPALMSVHNASLGVVQNVGNFTFVGGVSADRYLLWRGTRTAYSFSGSASYRFNDNVSMTLFGRYSTDRSFYSMAAMPYMGTSGYGGFVTFMGKTVSMDVGVERYYDTFARVWVTSPIVTPKIRLSDKFTIELPMGYLVKEIIDDAVHNRKNRGGPMIMPQGMQSVGEIPFGTPEMPH